MIIIARIFCGTPCRGAVAAGRRRPPLSIDISCPHALSSKPAADGRTLDRFIDPATRTTGAASVNVVCLFVTATTSSSGGHVIPAAMMAGHVLAGRSFACPCAHCRDSKPTYIVPLDFRSVTAAAHLQHR